MLPKESCYPAGYPSLVNHPITVCLFVACVGGLSGCLSPEFHRSNLGRVGGSDAVRLPDLHVPDRQEKPFAGDGPSSPSLARTWAPVNVHVPVDGVYSYPKYTREQVWTASTARQRGDAAAAITALELDGNTRLTRLGEASAAGPIAIFEALVMVPRMLMHDPRQRVRSLPQSYWRTPAGVGVALPAEAN